MVMESSVLLFLQSLSRELGNQRKKKKDFLRIKNPTNVIKKKIVLAKRNTK